MSNLPAYFPHDAIGLAVFLSLACMCWGLGSMLLRWVRADFAAPSDEP